MAEQTTAEQIQTEATTATEAPADKPTPSLIEQQPADGETQKADGSEAQKRAPEKYDLKSETWDSETLGAFEEIARELNLDQDAAQGTAKKLEAAFEAASQRRIDKIGEQWAEETRKDPKLGGAKLQETLAGARKVLDQFPGGAALRQELARTGLGNHRLVIGLLHWMHEQMSDDRFVAPDASPGASPGPKTHEALAEAIYGKSPQ